MRPVSCLFGFHRMTEWADTPPRFPPPWGGDWPAFTTRTRYCQRSGCVALEVNAVALNRTRRHSWIGARLSRAMFALPSVGADGPVDPVTPELREAWRVALEAEGFG